jgi:hypothetical protein
MKKADPFTLGREKDPAGNYAKGSPSEWGEDVYEKNLSDSDSREETGHAAESKKDFGPSVKEAAIKQAKQIKAKAVKCVRIAEAMLPNASEDEIEDQGLDLMELSDRAVEATLKRLAEIEAEAEDAEAHEEDETEAEEVAKQARVLLAKVRGMIAELEETEEEAAEEVEEEAAEEEAAEEEVEEEEASEEAPEMSEAEKQASVLVKKAKGIILAAEAEEELGDVEEAEELKKEARKVLASARRVLAGLEDLHPALQENAKKMKEEGGLEEELPEASLEEKKAAAFRHLEAARRLMAEWEAECGKEEEAPEAPEAAEEDEEAMEEEVEADLDLEEAAEEDLDMIPSDKDEALEEIFMNEDMKDAQEAYEMAFNGEGKEEEAPVKTASKKGAKSLKSGIKISSVSNSDLSNLWDAPPDVSHLFK